MQSRRDFFKTALLGGAAFVAGHKLGGGFESLAAPQTTLHGFVPADEQAVRDVLSAFLTLEEGALPAPVLDVPGRWRPTVAGALREAAPRYRRGENRLFEVQVAALESPLPADLLVQQDLRVLDPAGGIGTRLVALRESLRGRDAAVAVTCRLADRPRPTADRRVLVIESGGVVQDRITLDGTNRRLEVDGPLGRTGIVTGAHGAHVAGASCRHETCRRQGHIAQPGQLIACAPNRLVLRVETA